MENINGSIAVKLLRDLEKKNLVQKRIYVLASSDNDYYEEKGFDYCISKPIKLEELEVILNKNNI